MAAVAVSAGVIAAEGSCVVVSRQHAALPSEVPHPIEALVEEGDSLPLVGPEVSC